MRTRYHNRIKGMATLATLAVMALAGHGQSLRTTYFMDGAQYRMQLNPAMTPSRGYVHIPGASNTGLSYQSNGIGVGDMIDIIKNSNDADYFMSDSFMGRLKEKNHAVANAGTDLVAAGWWQGKNFLSFNVGVKVNTGVKVPKSLFSFMREMRGMSTIDYSDYTRHIGGEELNVAAYTELGFGLSRQVNDRLSVGARVKALLGMGNANLKIRDAVVKTNLQNLDPDYNWTYGDLGELLEVEGTASIDMDADLECTIPGVELRTNGKAYVDEVKFHAKDMGLAGYGAALDAGVSYRLPGGFTVSAAVVDLGFINWSKGKTVVAHSNTSDLHFDSKEVGDIMRFSDVVTSTEPLNGDIMRLHIDEQGAKSRTTGLTTTLVAGADYAIHGDKLRLGALYTHRNDAIDSEDELTFSVNLHPSDLIDVAVSYSPVLSGGKSVGMAVKAGPLFVGTDYLFTGTNCKCFNALVGLSIPLGRKPKN